MRIRRIPLVIMATAAFILWSVLHRTSPSPTPDGRAPLPATGGLHSPEDQGRTRLDTHSRFPSREARSPSVDGPDAPSMPMAADADSPDGDALEGEYTLMFFNARDREQFETLAGRAGIRILDRLTALHALRIAAPDRAALERGLAQAPSPLSLAPNRFIRISPPEEDPAASAPDRPYREFGNQAWSWMGIEHVDPGWGDGIRVAILDTGIPDGYRGRIATRLNLTGADADGSAHGGAVAALINGPDGLVPAASLLDIKILDGDGTGDIFTLARGILEAVDLGASLINISAGARSGHPVLEAAIAYAFERKVMIIAAAGNDGRSSLSYPAAYPGVLAVAGVDADGRHLYFSNTGEGVDLAAPGIGIAVQPVSGASAFIVSGTSASAPFATAAAALLLSEDSSLDPGTLALLLQRYSQDTGPAGPDAAYGAGILNAGRLLNRHRAGIVDLVALTPFIKPGAADTDAVLRIEVMAQNRGTTPIERAQMRLNVNGDARTLTFFHVGIGDTLAHMLEIPRDTVNTDGVDLQVEVVPIGLQDTYPDNNRIRMVGLPAAD